MKTIVKCEHMLTKPNYQQKKNKFEKKIKLKIKTYTALNPWTGSAV